MRKDSTHLHVTLLGCNAGLISLIFLVSAKAVITITPIEMRSKDPGLSRNARQMWVTAFDIGWDMPIAFKLWAYRDDIIGAT